jgi:hypothetical protein
LATVSFFNFHIFQKFFFFKEKLILSKLNTNQDTAETSEDEKLGKIVFNDAYGARSRKFGLGKATVINNILSLGGKFNN